MPLLRNSLRRKELLAVGLIALGGLRSESALAQRIATDPDAQSVRDRPRPEYQPVQIAFGSFNASASVNTSAQFDSNLFATANNPASDFVFLVQPRVSLQSNWSTNALGFNVSANGKRTLDNPTENTFAYQADANGRLDLGTTTFLTASASYAKAFVSRGSVQDISTIGRPLSYNQVSAQSSLSSTFGNALVGVDVAVSDYRYATSGGLSTAQSREQNFRSLNIGGSTGYAVGPGIAVVVNAAYNKAVYPDGTLDRDSSGYRVLGGVSFGASRLISGRASIGYQSQSYDNPLFPKVSGLDYQASLTWNPYRTLTVTGSAGRSIQRSALTNVAGILDTTYTLQADYEFRRNVIITTGVDYQTADFQGSPIKFRSLEGKLSALWLVSQNLNLTGSFNHDFTRSTDVLLNRFSRTQVSFGARLSL